MAQKLYKKSGIYRSCHRSCQGCTWRTILSIAGKILGWFFLTIVFFMVNVGLIMGFSASLNGKIYNMSTGCLFTEPACNQTIAFYAHSDLGYVIGWSTLLALAELILAAIIFAISLSLWRECFREAYYTRYENASYAVPVENVISEFPNVPNRGRLVKGSAYEEFDVEYSDETSL